MNGRSSDCGRASPRRGRGTKPRMHFGRLQSARHHRVIEARPCRTASCGSESRPGGCRRSAPSEAPIARGTGAIHRSRTRVRQRGSSLAIPFQVVRSADRSSLLITSANLTSAGINDNIDLGVLIAPLCQTAARELGVFGAVGVITEPAARRVPGRRAVREPARGAGADRGLADRVQHEAPAQQPWLARPGYLRRALGGSATRWTLITVVSRRGSGQLRPASVTRFLISGS